MTIAEFVRQNRPNDYLFGKEVIENAIVAVLGEGWSIEGFESKGNWCRAVKRTKTEEPVKKRWPWKREKINTTEIEMEVSIKKSIYYEVEEDWEAGVVVYTPSKIYNPSQQEEEVLEQMLKLADVSPVMVALPERTIELPTPPWVYGGCNGMSCDGYPVCGSYRIFLSEALEALKAFDAACQDSLK